LDNVRKLISAFEEMRFVAIAHRWRQYSVYG